MTTGCRFPRCKEPSEGVCTLCTERVCSKHAPEHFHVRFDVAREVDISFATRPKRRRKKVA